jgi:predicted DNA-binding transcriptional regulator YafY
LAAPTAGANWMSSGMVCRFMSTRYAAGLTGGVQVAGKSCTLSRTRTGRCHTVERHEEIIRQWQILMHIARAADCTIESLAQDHEVSDRTVRRDLTALECAGFPINPVTVDRRKYWRLDSKPMKAITETSFTLPELCAFYVNQTNAACMGGGLIGAELASALEKVSKALGPQMKAYLDKLTAVLTWKPDAPRQAASPSKQAAVDPLVRATIDHKRIRMDYHSLASGKTKTYEVEPYLLTFGNGGLYLYAYVPEYAQMRTFAVHRIKRHVVTDQVFSPVRDVPSKPFDASMGMYAGGKPEFVQIEFAPKLADYIAERIWHKSQEIKRSPDGSLILSMMLAIDVPLKTWILGFGHRARVLKPAALAEAIFEELEEAREQYAPRMKFELPPSIYDDVRQPSLPFRSSRSARPVSRRGSVRRPTA